MEQKKMTIDALMEQGKATGKLTTKEITDVLDELDFDTDQLASIISSCEQLNIEIVDDSVADDVLNDNDLNMSDDLEMTLSTEGIAIDDPVKIYLKEIGRVERGGDKPYHVVINGENYHALQTLVYAYQGQVDCIYIDPPYNTGANIGVQGVQTR